MGQDRESDAGGGSAEPLTVLADGRRVTTAELAPVLYEELRRQADALFRRERAGITLQPTALVHEAYVALADHDGSWEGRAHFLAVAATSMRRVLINAAKARGRQKRGGGWERVTLSEESSEASDRDVDLLALDEILVQLAELKPLYVRIIELRYFAGLSLDEVAQVVGMGRSKVVREWNKARAWLQVRLKDARG